MEVGSWGYGIYCIVYKTRDECQPKLIPRMTWTLEIITAPSLQGDAGVGALKNQLSLDYCLNSMNTVGIEMEFQYYCPLRELTELSVKEPREYTLRIWDLHV
jgi:hypothetical protein